MIDTTKHYIAVESNCARSSCVQFLCGELQCMVSTKKYGVLRYKYWTKNMTLFIDGLNYVWWLYQSTVATSFTCFVLLHGCTLVHSDKHHTYMRVVDWWDQMHASFVLHARAPHTTSVCVVAVTTEEEDQNSWKRWVSLRRAFSYINSSKAKEGL